MRPAALKTALGAAALALSTACLTVPGPAAAQAQTERPSILAVMGDDLGWFILANRFAHK